MSLFLSFLVLSLPPQLGSLLSSWYLPWIYYIIDRKVSCFIAVVFPPPSFFQRQLNSRMQVYGVYFPYLHFNRKINARATLWGFPGSKVVTKKNDKYSKFTALLFNATRPFNCISWHQDFIILEDVCGLQWCKDIFCSSESPIF